MPPTVSLVMIVKNEAEALPKCIVSSADLVQDIVVVDTGSEDDTRRVAAGLGARVIDFAWIDDFSAARNEGLRHATGDWIFWLDADEWLAPADRDKLHILFESLPDRLLGFSLSQRSPSRFIFGGVPDAYGIQTARQVRVFRNDPRVRWEGRVLSGRAGRPFPGRCPVPGQSAGRTSPAGEGTESSRP